MIQWTDERTEGLLKSYQKYAKSDKPTKEECIKAEINFMLDELEGDFAKVYNNWKKGDKSARDAGKIFCLEYEKPSDRNTKAKTRGENAVDIYKIMTK